MSEFSISVRNLSKCYKLGAIGRHTLVDECAYWWHRLRGRDPRAHMGKVGYAATGARRAGAAREGADHFWALKDVSFDVRPGEVIGIIGRNGAGKSTLLKILTRITEPTSGEAFVNGRVGSLLEVGAGFHMELTGRENIYMNGMILGMKKAEIERNFDEIVAFSELAPFLDTPVKRYSSGMYVRLAFAVAAHLEPEILLVDEVLAVGDVSFQQKCLGKMGAIARSSRTILFVSHNMGAIHALCHRCLIVSGGRIVDDGPPEVVVERYLADAVKDQTVVDFPSSATAVGFVRAEILDQNGHPARVFSSVSKVIVKLQYEVRRLVSDLEICIQLFDRQGAMICYSPQSDAIRRENNRFEPGRYTVEAVIPGGFLTPGKYSLTLAAFQPKLIQFDCREHALNFEINEAGMKHFIMAGMRIGAVVVDFPWRLIGTAPIEQGGGG